MRRDPRKVEFERVLARSRFRDAGRRERAILYHAVLYDIGGIGARVRRAGEFETGEAAGRHAEEVLARILPRPHEWTEELVAIRTVQTLAVLDLRNYRNIVWELGRYAEEEAPAATA